MASAAEFGLVILESLLGQGLIFGSPWYAGDEEMRVVIYGLLMVGMGAFGTLGALPGARRRVLFVLGGMGLYLVAFSQIQHLTVPLAEGGRGLGGTLPPKIVTNLAEEIDVFFRPPSTMLGLTYAVLGVSAVSALRGRWRTMYAVGLMALSYALVFAQEPLALGG